MCREHDKATAAGTPTAKGLACSCRVALTWIHLLATGEVDVFLPRLAVLQTWIGVARLLRLGLHVAAGAPVVSSHRSNRTFKMVFTRPCSPEAWVGWLFATAALLSALIHRLFLALASLPSVALDVSVLDGFVYQILPMKIPFSEGHDSIYSGLQVQTRMWADLGGALGYALAPGRLSCLLSVALLRRSLLA